LDWVEEEEDEDEDEGEESKPVVHHGAPKEEEEEYPHDCCPPPFYVKFPIFMVDETPFGVGWANIRLKTFRLIENKYFETAVIIMILLSSLALVSCWVFSP
jgi:voltage-gated sodium channel type II alpha